MHPLEIVPFRNFFNWEEGKKTKTKNTMKPPPNYLTVKVKWLNNILGYF